MLGATQLLLKIKMKKFRKRDDKMIHKSKTYHNHKIIVWTVLSIFIMNGCSTMHLPDYQSQPFSQYQHSQVKDGLAVAIHPLTTKEENKKYFGTDLLSANILAVLVVAKNRSSSSSFILLKDRFSMGIGQSEKNSVSGRNKISSETGGQVMAIAGATLISFPLLFIGAKMISDASVIKHNFAVKELQKKTISPGETVEGFVYFPLPEKEDIPGQLAFHLKAQDLKSKGIKKFDYTYNFRKEEK